MFSMHVDIYVVTNVNMTSPRNAFLPLIPFNIAFQ